ncbi:MAG: hypothetical protein FWD23_08585 [Oscillospiraceae bacterium]|nr:hypothetical protein [Oscillospiraceae bacterium]
MKKLLAALLAGLLVVSALSMAVFAGDGDDYGPVAKTNETIVIDGEKDEAYGHLGLSIVINREVSDIGTQGVGTILWSDGFLYVFGEITDPAMIPPEPDKQENTPWTCDSLEVFIDQNNTGDTAENVMQYRIDITGWPCTYNQGGLADYGQANVGSQFEYAHKIVDGGYNVEFKIPISVGEGAQIGIQFQINDVQDADGTQQVVYSKNDKGESGSWTGESYGFITLGALKTIPRPQDAAGGKSIIPGAQFVDGGEGVDVEVAANMFDGDVKTKYCATDNLFPYWASWKYDQAYTADRLIFATANDNAEYPRRMCDGWTLSGSNDGSAWDVIYTGKADDYQNENFTYYYVDLPGSAAYQYYKLYSETGGDSNVIQLSEVVLCGTAGGTLGGGGGSAPAGGGDTPAAVPTPSAPPATGNTGIIVFAVMAMASAGVVLAKKRAVK